VEMARPPWWLAALAWAGIAAVCAAASRRFRDLRGGFWILAGLVLLAPSSTLFPAVDLSADRRLYLPMIAFSAGAGLQAARMNRRLLACVAAVLIAISIHYSLIWRTPEKLWNEAKEHAPGKIRPRLQLARALPLEQAFRELDEAQRLEPGDPDVAAEQGRVLLASGHSAEALAAFGRELALSPGDARALNNRGAALAALGQADAARGDFLRALALDPCLFDARVNLKRMGAPEPEMVSRCRFTPGQKAEMER